MIWTPCSAGGSEWAGDHNDVAIQIPDPALPVIRPTVAIRRVLVARHDYLDTHISSALHDCVEIIDFKPQQHAVSVWPVVRVANRTVVVVHLETVQLKNKLSIRHQLFICGAAMSAAAAQEPLIPSAACLHIGYSNQRFGAHAMSVAPNIAELAKTGASGRLLSRLPLGNS